MKRSLQNDKNKLMFLFIAIIIFFNIPLQNARAMENADSYFALQSKNIFRDTPNPINNSGYFSLVIKNINNGKMRIINYKQAFKTVSPASTFKIVLALMGYDSDILADEFNPRMEYDDEYKAPLDSWKKAQTPATWMKYSVVWYSQRLTILLGLKKFQHYVELFNYGNKDIKGNAGRGSFLIKDATYVSFAGLINCWLGSTLKISPFQQVAFLQKLVENKLPVSRKAMSLTKKIIYKGKLDGNTDLYGKTGTAEYYLDDKNKIRIMWFVGWLETKENTYVFAANRYVNVPVDEPYRPFADLMSEYLRENFSGFGIE